MTRPSRTIVRRRNRSWSGFAHNTKLGRRWFCNTESRPCTNVRYARGALCTRRYRVAVDRGEAAVFSNARYRENHDARTRELEALLRGTPAEQKLLRLYIYSDRIRYYWHRPEIAEAVDTLIANLSSVTVPESMCSRYLPAQYARLRKKQIAGDPVSLIVDRIRDMLRVYAAACGQSTPL
jgi:hypothetical protein